MRSIVFFLYLTGMAVCFGKVASRLGHNPFLFGILLFIPLANLAAMAFLAFEKTENSRQTFEA
jgi:hypothetical protein